MKKHKKKILKRKERGITLIALVITIIVLLILAGVSIAMLTGQNGILTQAQKADVENRGAAVEEAKDLWKNSQKVDKTTGSKEAQSLDELLADLQNQGLLTEEEVATIKSTGSVQIGTRTIEFGTGVTTIGDVYTDDMIGQKVTYSSNGQSDWIIFGKDKDGNVLLTTAKPIDNVYELYSSVQNWLNYEDDLNAACSGYGATIKDRTVTSRSITLDDINYVSGFDVSKLNFDTYTFGTELDYENKKVDYYYPSSDVTSSDYWKKATGKSDSKTFENNWYAYYSEWDTEKLVYYYSGTDHIATDATEFIKNPDKVQYIWGGNTDDTTFNNYLVASRSVVVDSDEVLFYVAFVGDSGVFTQGYYLCYSNSSSGYDHYRGGGSLGIRPIVVLPSDIEVEKNEESGLYDIAY